MAYATPGSFHTHRPQLISPGMAMPDHGQCLDRNNVVAFESFELPLHSSIETGGPTSIGD